MTEQIGRLESKWTSVNGLSIYARVSVDPVPVEDSAIVMVHGLVVSSRYMVPTAIRLAPYYHVYAPDLPGFGKSDKPLHVLDITELSDVLADWMQAIGLKQATLLGNSMGCQVIANLALRHPERVSRVILMGPTMDPRARKAYQVIIRWLLNAPREPFSLFPIVARDYLAAGLRRFVLTFRDALQDRIEKHLPHVRVPGLVVRGEYDTIVPERWAEEAARLLPQGQLVVIARAAHDVNYDSPVELTRVVRAFMGGELS
jgi:2-hydroxy-6-oxonona-2,4-dienedioate hydrolase